MKKAGDTYLKDANSDEPLGFDWSSWLAELGTGVSIQSSTWTITGSDGVLTTHDASILANGRTQAYFSAGTVGVKYTITNRVVTGQTPPVTDDRSFSIVVVNK